MARFDVYRDTDGLLVLDVQADTLPYLHTRAVVPLFLADETPRPLIDTLNPVFAFGGSTVTMMTQYLGAVPQNLLGEHIGSLATEDYRIGRALDMLLSGF